MLLGGSLLRRDHEGARPRGRARDRLGPALRPEPARLALPRARPGRPRGLPRAPRASSGSAASSSTRSTSINLASPKDDFYEKSVTTLCSTVDAACAIEAEAVVFHVGSHLGAGFEAAARAGRAGPGTGARALQRDDLALHGEHRRRGRHDRPLARGAGRALRARSTRHPRLGVCLDSCHLYASGYDITDRRRARRAARRSSTARSGSTGCAACTSTTRRRRSARTATGTTTSATA